MWHFRPPASFCPADEKALVKFAICQSKYEGLKLGMNLLRDSHKNMFSKVYMAPSHRTSQNSIVYLHCLWSWSFTDSFYLSMLGSQSLGITGKVQCRSENEKCYFIVWVVFKGTVKGAKPCKCVALLVSRILSRKRINPLIFDAHQQLSDIISPFKFTQCHSSECCLLTLKKLVT